LPLPEDYQQVNVETQISDSTSILNLYKKLLAYRNKSPALQLGGYRPFDSISRNCLVYLRELEGATRLLVALNFSPNECRLNLAPFSDGYLVVSTALDRSKWVNLSDLKLRGHEGVIVELSGD
jgi:glycosidase